MSDAERVRRDRHMQQDPATTVTSQGSPHGPLPSQEWAGKRGPQEVVPPAATRGSAESGKGSDKGPTPAHSMSRATTLGAGQTLPSEADEEVF